MKKKYVNNKIDWQLISKEIDELLLINKQEPENTDWIEEILSKRKTKNDVANMYIKGLIEWYSLLHIAIKEDEFEVCQKVMQVLQVEEDSAKEIIQKYYGGLTPSDIAAFERMKNKVKELFL